VGYPATFGEQIGNHLVDRLQRMEAGVTGQYYPEISPGLKGNATRALDRWEEGNTHIAEIIRQDAKLRQDFMDYAGTLSDKDDKEKWLTGIVDEVT
jgi:hypothetical protein